MSAPPPPVVTGDPAARTRGLAERYSPWRGGGADLGDGLVAAFARLAQIVADRVNAMPEKNFLAFLDLVGVRQLAPRPARVPLTFRLAAGTTAPVHVPAGTRVAAVAAEGETEPPVYETQRGLVAIPASLQSVLTVDPQRDRFRDATAAAEPGQEGPFPAFAGTEPLGHALYLAHDAVLGLETPKDVDILLAAPGAAALHWLGAIEWSRWDGERWEPAAAATTVTEGAATVTLPALPAVPPSEVGGRRGRFLRARLTTTVPRGALRREASGPTVLAQSGLAPDAAFADGEPLDFSEDEAAVPFDRLAPPGSFLLACDDAFSKPGALVRLDVRLDAERPSAPSGDLALVWECSTEGGWRSLAGDPGRLEDGTYGLARSGRVSFRCPGDWRPSTAAGIEARWLRARIAAGGYEPAQPPRIAGLSIGYEWSLPFVASLRARARVDRSTLLPEQAFANQSPVDLNKDFFPFGEKPVLNDTLYVASDEAFGTPGSDVTLTVALTNPADQRGTPPPATPSADLALRWEYWSGATRRWETLAESGPGARAAAKALTDGTAAFTRDGTVTFRRPAAMAPVEVNGERRVWLRARIASGNYGVEAHYVPTADAPGFRLQTATFRPPSIRSLTLGYRYTTAEQPLESAVAENAFRYEDRTQLARPGQAGFEPFRPPDDDRPALYLGLDMPFPDTTVALYLAVAPVAFGGRARRTPAGEPANVVWEYWNGETGAWAHLETQDETRALSRRGLVSFVGPRALAPVERFGLRRNWLRARWDRGVYAAPPLLDHVLTNTTWADHAETIRDETLGAATGERSQELRLARAPILPGEWLEVREPEPPPASELVGGAGGDVFVRIVPGAGGRPAEAWVRWEEVLDFYGSGPRSRHYTLDRLTGIVRFGDGRRGLVPPAARDNVVARSYRTGGGLAGNRPAGAITELLTTLPYVDGAVNHEPAAGGTAGEALERTRERGPTTLRHGGRAVTASDFEDLALEASPAVARVAAVAARGEAEGGRVGLVVLPRGDEARPVPTLELLEQVEQYLADRAAPVFDLHVTGPGWLEVAVAAEVVPTSLDLAADVESAVRIRLGRFLHPLTGGFDGAGWPFGRRPHRSDLYTVLEGVDGVDHVRALSVRETLVEEGPFEGVFVAFSGAHDIAMSGGS